MGGNTSSSQQTELQEENEEKIRNDQRKITDKADEEIRTYSLNLDKEVRQLRTANEAELKDVAKEGLNEIDKTIKDISDKIRENEEEIRKWQFHHRASGDQIKADLKREASKDLEKKRQEYSEDLQKLEERKALLCQNREEILKTIRTANAQREEMRLNHEKSTEKKEGLVNEEIYKSKEKTNKKVEEKKEEENELTKTGQAQQLAITDQIHKLNNFRFKNSNALLDSLDSKEQHDKTRAGCDILRSSFNNHFKTAYRPEKNSMITSIGCMEDKEKLNVFPETKFLSETLGMFTSQVEAFEVPTRLQDILADPVGLAVEKSEKVSEGITKLEVCFKSYTTCLKDRDQYNLTLKDCETDKLKEFHERAKKLFKTLDEDVQELSALVQQITIPPSNEVNEMLNKNFEAICQNPQRVITPALPGSTKSIAQGANQPTEAEVAENLAVVEE